MDSLGDRFPNLCCYVIHCAPPYCSSRTVSLDLLWTRYECIRDTSIPASADALYKWELAQDGNSKCGCNRAEGIGGTKECMWGRARGTDEVGLVQNGPRYLNRPRIPISMVEYQGETDIRGLRFYETWKSRVVRLRGRRLVASI